MRVEPHDVGSVMHIIKRGARGLPIVRDDTDRKNFLLILYYLNTQHQDQNWRTTIERTSFPLWPKSWPEREPLIGLWAYTLMPNHFHLIVQEIKEGGIAKFMQRLCGSMSAYANARYNEKGSLFQGGYKARAVNDDADLRWLASYVMVKNTFELYPGGLSKAVKEFERTWQWGVEYNFSSMGAYGSGEFPPLIQKEGNLLRIFFKNAHDFKRDSKTMLEEYVQRHVSQEREKITLEK